MTGKALDHIHTSNNLSDLTNRLKMVISRGAFVAQDKMSVQKAAPK